MGGADATAGEDDVESGPAFGDGLDDVVFDIRNNTDFEEPDRSGFQCRRVP